MSSNPKPRTNADPFAEGMVEMYAEKHKVNPRLVKGISDVETGFRGYDPQSISPAGARGTMQVMKGTGEPHVGKDRFNTIGGQIEAGVMETKRLHDKYNGDVDKIVKGYLGGYRDPYTGMTSNRYANQVKSFLGDEGGATAAPDTDDPFAAGIQEYRAQKATPPTNQADAMVREMTGQPQVAESVAGSRSALVPARGISPAKPAMRANGSQLGTSTNAITPDLSRFDSSEPVIKLSTDYGDEPVQQPVNKMTVEGAAQARKSAAQLNRAADSGGKVISSIPVVGDETPDELKQLIQADVLKQQGVTEEELAAYLASEGAGGLLAAGYQPDVRNIRDGKFEYNFPASTYANLKGFTEKRRLGLAGERGRKALATAVADNRVLTDAERTAYEIEPSLLETAAGASTRTIGEGVSGAGRLLRVPLKQLGADVGDDIESLGKDIQRVGQFGVNEGRPEGVAGAVAEGAGAIAPEMAASLMLPETRLAHGLFWSGVGGIKSLGRGETPTQALKAAAVNGAMLYANKPLSPLMRGVEDTLVQQGVKQGSRAALSGLFGYTQARVEGASHEDALASAIQFAGMEMAGGKVGREEPATIGKIRPREVINEQGIKQPPVQDTAALHGESLPPQSGTDLQAARPVTPPNTEAVPDSKSAVPRPEAEPLVEAKGKGEEAGNVASVPFMITREQHQALADLGYSANARRAMTPEIAQGILAEGRGNQDAPKATVPIERRTAEGTAPDGIERRGVEIVSQGQAESTRTDPKERAVVNARERERRTRERAATDSKTGLQNKNEWDAAKDRIDNDPTREVVSLDLNDLKAFNDTHGHAAGDDYLRHVGKVALEEGDKLGILPTQIYLSGGDEINIDAPKGKGAELLDRLRERIGEFERGEVRGSTAGGVGDTSELADVAMYKDKKAIKAARQNRTETGQYAEGYKDDSTQKPSVVTPSAGKAGRGGTGEGDGIGESSSKERRLPKTLEAAGLEGGNNRTYTPETLVDGAERGKAVVADKGIDASYEWVKNPDNNGIEWASVGYEAMAQSRAQEAGVRASDPKAADAIAAKRVQFVEDFAVEATKRGQAIAGIRAIEEFAPDRAAYIATKMSKANRGGRGLSVEEEARITTAAEKASKANETKKRADAEWEAKQKEVAATTPKDATAKKSDYKSRLAEQGNAALKALKEKLGLPYTEPSTEGGASKPKAPRKQKIKESDTLTTAIVKMGGIKLEGERGREIQSRLDKQGRIGLLTESGRPIEDVIHDLEATGYPGFTKENGAVGTDALNELSDRIERELKGDRAYQVSHQEKLDADLLAEDFEDWGTPKLDLRSESKPGEKGAIRHSEAALEGDAELLAQYTASRLDKVNTVAEMKAELRREFGEQVESTLDAVLRRAAAIKQEARLTEMRENPKPERKRTIMQEINADIASLKKQAADAEAAQVKAEREYKAQVRKEQTVEGRRKAKEVRIEERRQQQAEATEARNRAEKAKLDYREASKARVKSYHAENRATRRAEKAAGVWDKPIRTEATEAKTRLTTATDAKTAHDDLVAVAAEMLLPTDGKTLPRMRAMNPAEFYAGIKKAYPDLVTKKNQGQVYKDAFERVRDSVDAAREIARNRSADAESKKMWDKLGIDEEAQAILYRRARAAREQQAARGDMATEFNRVSRTRLKKVTFELANLPRALQSSVDAPLGRQGLFYMVTHPIETARYTLPATLKGYSALRRGDFAKLTTELQRHPDYELAKEAGVDLPDIISEASAIRNAEEDYASQWAERLPHVRLSEQGFTLGMNTARIQAFSRYADFGRAEGYTMENNPQFFKDAAHLVNAATGRGNMPETLKKATALTNALFYSTRLQVSRVQLMNDLFNPAKYVKYDPVMRRIAAKEALRGVVGMAVLLGTAKALGASVTLNPDDPDFGKIVVGKTHYDATGGNGALFRFFWQFSKAAVMTQQGRGKELKQSQQPGELLEKFTRSKLAPLPGGAWNVVTGKDFLGEPANLNLTTGVKTALAGIANPLLPIGAALAGKPIKGAQTTNMKMWKENQILKLLSPMIANDITDAAVEDGWLGVAKVAPALGGIGVSTYQKGAKRGKRGASGVSLDL